MRSRAALAIIIFLTVEVAHGKVHARLAQLNKPVTLAKLMRPRKSVDIGDNYFIKSKSYNLMGHEKGLTYEKKWALSLDASSSSDLAKSKVQRNYNHSLSTAFNYEFMKDYHWNSNLSFKAYAQDDNIPKETGNPAVGDLNTSLNQTIFKNSNLSLSHAISETIPTSEESRIEGISSVLGYGVSLSHQLWRLNFNHSLQTSYVLNAFDYSPTTNKKNTNWLYGYSLSANLPFPVTKEMTLGLRENVSSRNVDEGSFALRSSTSVYSAYVQNKWTFSLSYLYGNYDENDHLRLFYLDDMKQIVNLGLAYEI